MQPFLPLTASFFFYFWAQYGRIQDFFVQNLVKWTQNVGEDIYIKDRYITKLHTYTHALAYAFVKEKTTDLPNTRTYIHTYIYMYIYVYVYIHT